MTLVSVKKGGGGFSDTEMSITKTSKCKKCNHNNHKGII